MRVNYKYKLEDGYNEFILKGPKLIFKFIRFYKENCGEMIFPLLTITTKGHLKSDNMRIHQYDTLTDLMTNYPNEDAQLDLIYHLESPENYTTHQLDSLKTEFDKRVE